MKKSRIRYSAYNSIAASLSQFLSLVMSFISRTIFIKILGEQYLGLNGLFTNILNLVSFAELGIGAAITYSLYEPLAKENYEQILALMQLYKKVYRIIALIILIIGLVITPFLRYLINGNTYDVGNIYIAFLLFLSNSVLSYLWNYKRSIFFADQAGYVNSLNMLIFQIGGQIFQVAFLLIHPSYYLYLIIQTIFTVFSNIQISYLADKRYPFLKNKNTIKVSKKIVGYIRKNVTGMISAKLGGIIVNGTDNIILSAFLGLGMVGIYSNYTLILNGMTNIVNQGISAVTSSIGNMHVTESKIKQQSVFYEYTHITGVIGFTISVGLISFFSPFVNLWVGRKYILNIITTWLIVINFFVVQLRQANINFTNAYGLYWEQRIKPIYESLVNLVISLLLVSVFSQGIKGVIIGTLASNIFVNAWWEPLIVLRNGIQSPFWGYVKFYLVQLFVGVLLLTSSQYISNLMPDQYLILHAMLTAILIVGLGVVYDFVISKLFPKDLNCHSILQIITSHLKNDRAYL